MSLDLSIAIHAALCEGQDSDVVLCQPYAGCWVPHAHLLGISDDWVLSPDTEYDCTDVPAELCVNLILFTPDGYGWIYCYDGDCATCFRIQRKES